MWTFQYYFKGETNWDWSYRYHYAPTIKDLLDYMNRKIEIGKTPMTSLFAGEVSYTDHDIHPGVNPYWAKITQQDMEMAWVSPVFASYYPLDV